MNKLRRLAGVVLWAGAVSAGAATIDWTNTSGGVYNTPGNWQGGVVPGNADLARFAVNGTFGVSLSSSLTNEYLRFDATTSVVSLNLAGSTLVVTNALTNSAFYVGYTAGRAPVLVISNSNLRTERLQLAANSSYGEVTLRDGSNDVIFSGGLAVGLTGTGLMTIANAQTYLFATGGGSHVVGDSAGSLGTLVISNGLLSMSGMDLGRSGEGVMRVVRGTNLLSGTLVIGRSPGARGTVYMEEPGAEVRGALNLASGTGTIGRLYLRNGLYHGNGETKVGDYGEALIVMSGGSLVLTNNPGNFYLPRYTGTGTLVMAHPDSSITLQGTSRGFQLGADRGHGEMIMSNGSLRIWNMQIGTVGAGAYGSLHMYNATNILTDSGGRALTIGDGGGTTGLMVMADERALVKGQEGGTGGGTLVGHQGDGTLILSNGTMYTKGLFLGGNAGGRGLVIIEDARVYVQTNAVVLGNNNGAWGWMLINHPDALLDNEQGSTPSAVVGGGDAAGGEGYLYMSNGLARFYTLGVSHAGLGYMEVGAATVTVASALNIPHSVTTSDGTGTLVMVSADAVVESTNLVVVGSDAGNDNVRNAVPMLLVSNGVMRVGEVRVGRRSDGYMYIGAATVTVVRTGDAGFNMGSSSSLAAGTGTVVLGHSGALLDSPNANFRMCIAAESTSRLRLSNGVMNIASLRLGVANRSLSDFWVGDGTVNSTGDWQTAAAANTTSLFTMAHVNSLVSITNGSVSMAIKSNSVSIMTISNGTFLVPFFDIGSATAGDAGPAGNGELRIHAGTVSVALATATAYGMNLGGRAGNTGVVMLTHSAGLLAITNGSRLRLGNSGSAFLVVSSGTARVSGEVRLGESEFSRGEISVYDGEVDFDSRLTIGFSGAGVVNLDHPNALLQVGAALWMGDTASAQTNGSGALNISNGTVRLTTPGQELVVSSYNQTGRCPSVVNLLNGTLDLNGGAMLVGNRQRGEGTFNLSGGTALCGRITLLGFSSATLAGATGTLAVSGGTLYLGALNTLGTTPGAVSNVWLSGGTIRSLTSFVSSVNMTLTNAPGAGLVTFDIDTNVVQLSGAIGGPGRLRKTGDGQLILNAVNNYGGTEVSEGVLAVQARTGSGTGTGWVNVAAGGTLVGTGLVSYLNLGGGMVSPGAGTNLVGSLLAGVANWTNGVYQWDVQDLAGGQWDTLSGTGALTIAGGIITIRVTSVVGGGQLGAADNYDVSSGYTCVIASATSIGGFDANKFVIDTSGFVNDEGATWSIATSSTNVVLVITPPLGSSRWVYWDANNGTAGIQAGSGLWTTTSNSWLVGGSAPNVAWDNSTRDKALFSFSSAGPHTVLVSMAVATNSGITMPSASTYHYEVGGTGTLALVGQSAAFHVEQSSANLMIAAPLQIATGGLVKSGRGTLYLDNPSAENMGGVLVKTGKLYIGRGSTGGEVGAGVITVLDGGPELYFNRSSYTITNPIAGGRTYITNSGGGYAWRAGATQDFVLIRNDVAVTQETGSLVFTNYLRIESQANPAKPVLTLKGGYLYAPSFEIGAVGAGTATVEVAGGFLQAKTNSVGGGSDNNKGARLILSSGLMQVDNSLAIGKSAGSQSNVMLQTDGICSIPGGTFIVWSNGFLNQTGGLFSNQPPSSSSSGSEIQGVVNLSGGTFFMGGSFLRVGLTARTRFGEISQLSISNDASFQLVEVDTNISRTTFISVGVAGNSTGRVLVTGGSLIMTNSLGVYTISAVARSNSGDIVLGWGNAASHGILDIQGGTTRVYQVWFGGHNFRDGSGSAFAAINPVPSNIRAELFLSGGELYTLRGFSNWHTGASSYTNVALSGGTLGALGNWTTSLDANLTNSPGPGVTRFDPAGYRMTLAGALRGPGGLSLDGDGVLVVSNNNSALGGLNYVSNGFLEVGNGAGAALGTNTLMVTAGGSLGGTGRVSRVNFQSGGFISPGTTTNVGALTAGLTTWSNTSYRFEILDFSGAYGTGWDRFSSTGVLTIASGSINTIKVTSLSAAGSVGAALNYASGTTYTQLIASAASISGFDAGAFVIETGDFLNDEVVASVQLVGGTNIALVLAPGSSGNNRVLYWDAERYVSGLQNGGGTWNGVLANWRNTNGLNLAWNNGRQDYAVLGGAAGSGNWTVSVGIVTATNIGFSFLSGGQAYTVAGTGYLSFVGSAMVTADAPGTVTAGLEGTGFTKVGGATLTLGGSNRHTGVITVSNGAVRLTHIWALGSTNGATVVAAGGEVVSAVGGTVREPLVISGSGTNGQGAIRFTVNTPTWIGTVGVASASARIGVDSGISATLSTVVTGGVADVFVGGAGRLLVNGGVNLGSGKVVKDGSGVLSMRGPSSYAGGTIVSAGTVRVCGSCAANVLGTAAVLLENNTVLGSETASSTISNPLNIWGNVQLVDSSAPYNKDLTVTGAVDLNAAVRTVTVPSGVASLSGAISNGGLNKKGSGTLVLAGANTYASATIVSNGTLILNGTNASSAVTSVAGTKLLGSGSLAATTLNGELDAGSGLSVVGSMSVSSLNLRPSSSVRVTITNANQSAGVGYDTINCAGTLTISSTVGGGECVIVPDSLGKTPANFSNGSTYSWKIISAGALSGFAANKFTVSTASFAPALGGGYFSVTTVGTDLYLKFLPSTEANLRLSVSDSPDPVGLSNSVTYSLTITNLSQATASPDMVVTNWLDPNMTYQSSSSGGSHSGGIVTWTLSSLAGGGSTTLTVVARANLYVYLTNAAHVSTEVPDALDDDNWATNLTEVACVSSLVPTINPVGNKSVVANNQLAFTVSAFDSGCGSPSLSMTGAPYAASLAVSSVYPNAYGTFTWTPGPSDAGTYPVRFTATDSDGHLTSLVLRIYVAGVGEPTNSSGVPVSQTNWHVIITNLTFSGGNDAQVVWRSDTGITYDIYTSVGSLGGGGMSWTRSVSGYEAEGSMSTSEITAAESRRYFKVVLQHEGVRDSNGVWGVFRPSINPGFNLMAIPLDVTNRSFAGEFGDTLAAVLTGDNSAPGDGEGDEALLLESDGVTFRRLYLDGANPGRWRNSGGSYSTDVLAPGQGFFILRNGLSPVQPTFTAPVGNLGIRTNTIVEGFNLMGVAEGWYNITFTRAFSDLVSGSLVADWDEEVADQIMILNDNGSYSRFWRAPDGWRNAANDALATTNAFNPGRSYYFRRVDGAGSLRARF